MAKGLIVGFGGEGGGEAISESEVEAGRRGVGPAEAASILPFFSPPFAFPARVRELEKV